MLTPITRSAALLQATRRRWALGAAASFLLATPALAQTPTVTSLTPSRNAVAAPRSTNVALTYSQALSNTAATQGALKAFSQQAGGQKAGSTTVSGNTLTFNPALDFKGGETVFATATAGVQSSGGTAATPHVFQFTTATSPSTGTFGNTQLLGSVVNFSTIQSAIGDIDGDGDLDLLYSYGGNGIGVYLNDGTGTYVAGPLITSGASSGVRGIALADLDGDGDLDLAVTAYRTQNRTDGQFFIRYNQGGVFSGTQAEFIGSNADFFDQSITPADVDGDGDIDLLYPASYGVVIVTNNGRGTVSITQGVGSSIPNAYVANQTVGDVDNDGDLDLLFIMQVSGNAYAVALSLNQGNGTFGAATTQVTWTGQAATRTPAISLGDLDGDGDLDLITDNGVYANTGGTFGGSPLANSQASTAGDVDGDGDLDLIYGTANSGTINVRLNNGSGSFTSGQALATGLSTVGDTRLGDVDGNGSLDVVAFGRQVSVSLNQPAAASPVPVLSSLSSVLSPVGSSIVVRGINLTGTTSVTFNGVAATSFVVNSSSQLTVIVPAGATNGPLVVTTPSGTSNSLAFSVGPRPASVSVVPALNTLAASTTTPVTVAFDQPLSSGSGIEQAVRVFSAVAGGKKAGTTTLSGSTLIFTPTVPFKAGEQVEVDVATPAANSRVVQFRTATAPSSGVFGAQSSIVIGTPSANVTSADIDGDGDLDLLAATTSGIIVRYNAGDGTFFGSQRPTLQGDSRVVRTADLDNDGDLDIVSLSLTTTRASIYKNDGTGLFTLGSVLVFGTSENFLDVTIGDISGDGYLDLVFARYPQSGGGISFSYNDGAGNFSAPSGGAFLANFAGSVALGDIDADGDLDVVVSSSSNSASIVRLNNGSVVNVATLVFGGTTVNSVGGGNIELGDLDKDGDLDMVVTRTDNGRINIGLNDGSGVFTATAPTASVHPGYVELGDIDGDGDLDLVTQGGSVYLNNGNASFSVAQTVATTSSTPLLADIDGNGTLDLLSYSLNDFNIGLRLNQPLVVTPPTNGIRLNAGGLALTTTRGQFATDQYFSANSSTTTSTAAIAGTEDDALYQSERYSTGGQLSYAVPVANGQYTVVLHFAETYWTQPGQRVFNINLEGSTVRTNYDIVAKVGPLTATTETYTVQVTDGVLNLDLVVPYLSGADQAKLSALEVLPITTATRLNAGGPDLPTTRGAFSADQYFSAASATATTMAPIDGTTDDALYQSERYSTGGVLSYAVPVANGAYRVILHFAETYWTQPGQRVFNIGLENTTVRTNFDIVAKVGPLTATTETFIVNVTDGVLNLDLRVPYLTGGRDQAKLSALEVLPETSSRGALATNATTSAPLATELKAYPNPVTDGRFTLAYSATKAQAGTLTLVDQLGRTVHEQAVQVQVGLNQVPVPATQVRAGIYQLVLRTTDGQRLSQKLVVQP